MGNIVKFAKPYSFEGTEYTEVDLSGMDKLTIQDMIDISNTMLALSEDSATQKEIQDVARCLRTLYSTPLGSQEGDRSLGIDQGVFLDKPIEVAKALYVREVTEKTAEFEPRARVVRVDWQESDVVRGEVIPKVVYELV